MTHDAHHSGPSGRSHRPVFVIGCPRSGTTLLQQMLHCHPRSAMPSETRFVHAAYEERHAFGALEDAANRRELGEWITGRKATKFAVLGLDAGLVTEEIAAGPPTLGSALATVFRAYAREHGKERWSDKRPSYFRRVPMLRRMFPDAQFVHLVRDGRDAIGSLKGMPWYKGDVVSAALTWREAGSARVRAVRRAATARRAARALPPGRGAPPPRPAAPGRRGAAGPHPRAQPGRLAAARVGAARARARTVIGAQ
ncbi:sulfotransferase [Actinomadura sp. 21ATH]|uniref:sulfotransferase family protein n=1 Tax=Actinomadura sp. 21ATH TaxID=1735444 RepID=UPI0035BF1537